MNENDWDQYHIKHNTKQQQQQSLQNYRGRRLIEEKEEEYEFYQQQQQQEEQNDDEESENNYAFKCTDRIPVIFKHLCLEWNAKNGFLFSYHSSIDDNDRQTQTNWFYDSNKDKISSAKV